MLKVIVLLCLYCAATYAKFKPKEQFQDGYYYVPENRNDVLDAAYAAFSNLKVYPTKRSKHIPFTSNLRRILLSEYKKTKAGDVYRMILMVDSALCENKAGCTGLEKPQTTIYTVLVRRNLGGEYSLLSEEIPFLHTLMFNPEGCGIVLVA